MILKDWLDKYQKNIFDVKSKDTLFKNMVKMGWVDWFCDTKELPKRGKVLAKILLQITNGDLLENYNISFYNNCPSEGDLYDEIKFEHENEELNKGGFLKINSPYRDKKYDFISYEDFDNCDRMEYNLGHVSTFKTNSLEEMINFLNNLSL